MQMLLVAFGAASLTVVLHSAGVENVFYYTYWWYDLVTHALGGIAIGALVISLFAEKKWNTVHILLIALAPIVGWEVFENFFVNITASSAAYITDTVFDAVAGLLGAYGATLICRKAKGY